jgi:hypothetical protein
VARNDDLTARRCRSQVEGPLASASVSGQVLTNSRFLKNIDIIRSVCRRPRHPKRPGGALSFPKPPRDCKFDIVIKSKDPFLIRGNLATGNAIVDMKLAGTGLHPQLQGQVRLENFDATLPFSTLTIRLGFLYFDPDDPLNPRIELQGESLIQDYTVRVFVYGTAKAPQAIFSSAAFAAGRYHFSSGHRVTREACREVMCGPRHLLLGKSFEDFQKRRRIAGQSVFNHGVIRKRSGDREQKATAKYKASEHVILIGEIGLAGDFRGLVKYVIRFR